MAPNSDYLLSFLFRVDHREVLQGLGGAFRAISPHGTLPLPLFGFNWVNDTCTGQKTIEMSGSSKAGAW